MIGVRPFRDRRRDKAVGGSWRVEAWMTVTGLHGSFVKPPGGSRTRLSRGEHGTKILVVVEMGDPVPTTKAMSELPSVGDEMDTEESCTTPTRRAKTIMGLEIRKLEAALGSWSGHGNDFLSIGLPHFWTQWSSVGFTRGLDGARCGDSGEESGTVQFAGPFTLGAHSGARGPCTRAISSEACRRLRLDGFCLQWRSFGRGWCLLARSIYTGGLWV